MMDTQDVTLQQLLYCVNVLQQIIDGGSNKKNLMVKYLES